MKPDANEIANILTDMHVADKAQRAYIGEKVIANASPDLRKRLAAAIWPEGATTPGLISEVFTIGEQQP